MLQASAVIHAQVTEEDKIINVDLNEELAGVKFTQGGDKVQVQIKDNRKALEHEGTRLLQQVAVTEEDKIMKVDVHEELRGEKFPDGSEKVQLKMKENALSRLEFDKVYNIIFF